MEDYKFLFKVVLVGNAGVGKTCLVRRFTQGMFPPGQGATIGVDFMIKTVEIDGEKIKVRSDLSFTIYLLNRPFVHNLNRNARSFRCESVKLKTNNTDVDLRRVAEGRISVLANDIDSVHVVFRMAAQSNPNDRLKILKIGQ